MSEGVKESNYQQLASDLIAYVKQYCEGDNTPIVTAFSAVRSAPYHKDRKKILNILFQLAHQQMSEPSTEKGKPQISEESRKFAHDYKEEQSRRSSDSSDDSSTQPQTGTPSISDKERQKKLAASLAEFADYKPEPKKKSAPKQKRTIRSMFGLGGNKTKKSKKGMSLCAKKTAKKCTKVRGCKVASGKKRTYCRKKKNHTQKSNKK